MTPPRGRRTVRRRRAAAPDPGRPAGRARRVGSALRGVALVLVAVGCGVPSVDVRVASYREAVETLAGSTSGSTEQEADLAVAALASEPRLPPRRARRLQVGEERIGPFEFLSTVGCTLSEVVAARNGALGRVLVPTRRWAHELLVLEAGDACLPRLSEARSARLAERLARKRAELPAHAWNAVWLDEHLERFLSFGPRSLLGGGDSEDGGRRLGDAARALAARDVGGLERAFAALRDDPAAGPRLIALDRVARALDRVSALLAARETLQCGTVERRLVRVFDERYLPVQADLGELDRRGRVLVTGLTALFEASGQGFVVPEAMQRYRVRVVGDAAGVSDLRTRFRASLVRHAAAWAPILEVCGALPES